MQCHELITRDVLQERGGAERQLLAARVVSAADWSDDDDDEPELIEEVNDKDADVVSSYGNILLAGYTLSGTRLSAWRGVQAELEHRQLARQAMAALNSFLEDRKGTKKHVILEGPVVEVLVRCGAHLRPGDTCSRHSRQAAPLITG